MVKSNIIVIGDSPLVLGFQLAGLQHGIVATEEDFEKHLEETLANEEFGIILANSRLLSKIDWRLKKKLDDIAYPVIVPMPDVSGGSADEDEIRTLIKRALGFDLGKKD